MTDLAYALHVARRMTVAEWVHAIACMGIVVVWTLHALSRGASG